MNTTTFPQGDPPRNAPVNVLNMAIGQAFTRQYVRGTWEDATCDGNKEDYIFLRVPGGVIELGGPTNGLFFGIEDRYWTGIITLVDLNIQVVKAK